MNPIVILSGRAASEIELPYKYAHISIRDPNASEWPLSNDPNRVMTLRLAFWDERNIASPQVPKVDDLLTVVPFVLAWKDQVEGFVVNCAAGISRSAAVAAGISPLLGLDPAACYGEPHNPNPVVRTILDHIVYQIGNW